MHQIRFRLGLRPRPRWGSLHRSPDPLAGFEEPTSKGGEGKGGGMRGEGREEGRGGDGRGGRRREGRGGLSCNVAEEAFCLKSAPAHGRRSAENWRQLQPPTFHIVRTACRCGGVFLSRRGTDPFIMFLLSSVWNECANGLEIVARDYKIKWKKALGETKTLRAGHSNAEPKNFAPPQTPFPEAQDRQNLISWRWSLPLPTDRVWWRSMHAISSYRGNRHRPPVANAHRQDR